jgi:ectoine hydroxylase-related dioxygenase (phytanoyl-CoA dioxygenase family)
MGSIPHLEEVHSDTNDAELAERFAVDGFVSVGPVIDAELLATLSGAIDRIADSESSAPAGSVHLQPDVAFGPGTGVKRRDAVWQITGAHAYDPTVASVATAPRVLALAGLLLRAGPAIVTSQVIMKPAHHGGGLPWHQDASYWGERRVVTCWLAIDDATPENGCMRMIPGSHHRGQIPWTKREFSGAHVPLRESDGIDDRTQLVVPVAAGCASFHGHLTLHASGANRSDRRRRAIALTYGAA